MDRSIVEGAGVEFFGIPSGKLRRYFSLHNISDVFKVLAGFFAARRILKREAPALLFSKGGFVSVPPCVAANFLKIPVFTHESDFSPGLATKINSRFAQKIFLSYKESAAFFKGPVEAKLSVSGNPIRTDFAEADPAKGRKFLGLENDARILLVLGGSLGSREINTLVSTCLPELTKYYTVVHQTGEGAAEITDTAPRYKPFAYLRDELPHVIAAVELVLCRSGAGTIWECKALGKPMVLIPFRGSGTRGDQVENARLFSDRGAALYFTPEAAVAADTAASTVLSVAEKLSSLIAALAEDPERRRIMGEAKVVDTDSHDGNNAAAFIAEEIVQKLKD